MFSSLVSKLINIPRMTLSVLYKMTRSNDKILRDDQKSQNWNFISFHFHKEWFKYNM